MNTTDFISMCLLAGLMTHLACQHITSEADRVIEAIQAPKVAPPAPQPESSNFVMPDLKAHPSIKP